LDDFEAVGGIQDTLGELGWSYRFTIQFDDDGLGSELLVDEENLDGAGEVAIDGFAVGEEDGHGWRVTGEGWGREQKVGFQGCFEVLRCGALIGQPEPEGQRSGENCRLRLEASAVPRTLKLPCLEVGCETKFFV